MDYSLYKTYIRTIFSLIHADFLIFKENIHNQIIDNSIILVANLVIMGMIMPQFGLASNYAPFLLSGLIGAVGVFQAFPTIYLLVADISQDRKIVSYLAILPVPTWLSLINIIVTTAIRSFILSVIMLVIGLFLLRGEMSWLQVSYVQCIVIILLGSFFTAALALWITSMVRDVSVIESVWVRFIFPLWIFGGFQFSWAAMHAALGNWAYINLINPLLYVSEGLRSAMHINGEFISFGACVCMLILSIALFSWWALARLKKRLDYV